MGLNYSLGITFINEKDADVCSKEFFNQKIVLPGGNLAELFSYVSEHADNQKMQEKLYVLSVSINGLGNVDIDLRLFETSNFYTIRDFFYQYLRDLKKDFEFAHFELEAADYLMCAEEMTEDIAFLVKNLSVADEGAQKITGINPSEFLSKRYIDGIIIPFKNYRKLKNAQSEFQIFKPNYYWLPLKEFKFSK